MIEEEEEEVNAHSDDSDSGDEGVEMWQDDDIQMSLWDPQVRVRKKTMKPTSSIGRSASSGMARAVPEMTVHLVQRRQR